MYNPLSGCSAFVHLLIKHPILAIGLGLATAVNFLSPQLQDQSAQKAEQSTVFKAKIQELEASPIISKMAKQSEPVFRAIITVKIEEETLTPGIVIEKPDKERWFPAIKKAESGDKPIGVHPDGISYGPAGLTRMALEDVLHKIPSCQNLGYNEVLNDPELSTRFAHLYFLDLIHRFKDIEIAVIAYNNGPTKVEKWQKEGKELPNGYLNKVKLYL